MSAMIAVKLDHSGIGAGPGTVIATVETVAQYLQLVTDRDGARDPAMRLWEGQYPTGTRVKARLICGTGKGVTSEVAGEDD